MTTRVIAGVGGGALALFYGSAFKNQEKKYKQPRPRSIIMQTFFHGNPGKKKRKFRNFTSTIKRKSLNS